MDFNEWCTTNGIKDSSKTKMGEEEIDTMQGVGALTADAIDQLGLTIGQNCMLKKAVLRYQHDLAKDTPPQEEFIDAEEEPPNPPQEEGAIGPAPPSTEQLADRKSVV
jgi:hypothetical protein